MKPGHDGDRRCWIRRDPELWAWWKRVHANRPNYTMRNFIADNRHNIDGCIDILIERGMYEPAGKNSSL